MLGFTVYAHLQKSSLSELLNQNSRSHFLTPAEKLWPKLKFMFICIKISKTANFDFIEDLPYYEKLSTNLRSKLQLSRFVKRF